MDTCPYSPSSAASRPLPLFLSSHAVFPFFRDFDVEQVLTVGDQVDKLIKQATSQENLCQCYIGWCPFW